MEQINFSVSDNIGTITSEGLFTATNMPSSSGTIKVSVGSKSKTISVSTKAALVDISGHWAESYINSLFASGIVEGVGDNEFKPYDEIRRCDFVLMLWRAMDKPAATSPCTFTDVAEDSYYAQAVAWAEEAGITTGANGYFMPTDTLTREQAFTIVYRFMTSLGVQLPSADGDVLTAFSDSGEISSYARDAIASLVSYKMIEGAGGKLSPLSSITRGEMAKILYIALENN
jgi:hypothetical protein